MAFFNLSGITGCINSTGTTTSYAIKYNDALISSYYKKDIVVDFVNIYIVACVIGTHVQLFQFLNTTDRDNFYNTLP